MIVAGADNDHSVIVGAFAVPAVALIFIAVAMLPVSLVVFLFNRPILLVPPPYRRQRSALARQGR